MNRADLRPAIAAAVLFPRFAFCAVAPQLPPPAFADTEVTAHLVLNQGIPNARGLHFQLEFTGTPSNNVEIALGTDADSNGALSFDEAAIVVGWDCGRYFVERLSTGERYEESNIGTNAAARVLNWNCKARRGSIRSLAAENETGTAFVPLTAALPAWLYDLNWNLIRLTARGMDVQDERFSYEVRQTGYFIHLR